MDADGVPHQAFRKVRATDSFGRSQPVFDEITDVLRRPRLARFIDAAVREDLLNRLTSAAVWFTPLIAVRDCRDQKDNKYLELALAADASVIVTGDLDLLVLAPWRGIPILSPSAYLNG